MTSTQRTLTILVVLFTAPIAVAFLFATKVVDPRQFGLTNHGALVDPPIPVGDAAWLERLYPDGLAPSHWSVVTLFRAGPCDTACADVAEDLTSLPLILGQDGVRVSAAGLTTDGGCGDRPFPRCVEIAPAEYDALVADLAARSSLTAKTDLTVFMDWRDNVMLGFAHPFDRDDLKTDLKRLLKASRI